MLISSIVQQNEYQLRLISFFIKPPIFVEISTNKKGITNLKYTLTSTPPNKEITSFLLKRPKLIILTGYMIFLFLNGIYATRSSHVDFNVKVSATIFSILLPVSVFIIIILWFWDPRNLVDLLNMFLEYEKNHYFSEKRWKIWRISLKYFIWIFGFGFSLLAPISLASLNVLETDRLPFLGSLIPREESMELRMVFAHGVIIVFQTWQYYLAFPSYVLITTNIFIASILSLLLYLGEISR